MSGASEIQILLETGDERKPVVWLLDATGTLKPLAVQTIKSGCGSSQIGYSDPMEKLKINIKGRGKKNRNAFNTSSNFLDSKCSLGGSR